MKKKLNYTKNIFSLFSKNQTVFRRRLKTKKLYLYSKFHNFFYLKFLLKKNINILKIFLTKIFISKYVETNLYYLIESDLKNKYNEKSYSLSSKILNTNLVQELFSYNIFLNFYIFSYFTTYYKLIILMLIKNYIFVFM